MLELKFAIQGDPADKLLELQARGIVAALYSIYGESVLPLNLSRVTVASARKELVRAIEEAEKDNRAIFDEPSAAEAFEGNTAEYLAIHAQEPDAAAAFGGGYGNTDKGGVGPDGMITRPVAPAGDRDSAGIPWDERIHSSTKGTNKDGTWSRRRNTPDELFNAVMAELKGANTQRTVEAAQGAGLVPPPPPSVPAPPPATSAPSAPPVAPAASSPAPGGLIDPASATAFPDIMRVVTQFQAAGKIKPDEVNNLLISVGATKITDLLTRKDLIPSFQALVLDHVGQQ